MRSLIVAALIWLALSFSTFAQDITSVSYTDIGIVFGISGAGNVNVFSIGEGKPRIVIDIPEGAAKLKSHTLEKGPFSLEGKAGVKRLRFASRNKGVRLVLDLNDGVKLLTHNRKDNELSVELQGNDKKKVVQPSKIVGANKTPRPRFFENKIPFPRIKPDLKRSQVIRKPVIVVDPGHGGHDPGAIGVRGTKEKTITTAAAKELQKQLLETGRYKVIMTRTKDSYVDHEERLRIARAGGADLFISIHADSAGSKTARGASVYTLADRAKNRSKRIVNNQNWIMDVDLTKQSDPVGDILVDLAQRNTETQSEQFADLLLENLGQSTKLIGNSHRRAGYFVLLAPDVPAILLELGFLSNAQDEKLLNSRSHRKKVLRSVTRSINSYFDKVES